MTLNIILLGTSDLDWVGFIDLLTARLLCQCHTRAGHGVGLQDPRSCMFWKMLRVLRHLQVHHTRSQTYIVENIPLLGGIQTKLMASIHEIISWIRSAVLLDVARIKSRAHCS